jgi:hypothetical protein
MLALNESDPAQDIRAHDGFAQLGLGDYERAERFFINDDDLAIGDGACRGDRSPAGECGDLAGETAGAMCAQ